MASGANLAAFTTGRGSCFASSPRLHQAGHKLPHVCGDMDINCGDIMDAGVAVQEKGSEIFARMLGRRL
ncbi:hypothetical protein [Ramlibacter alkalitolerans]|uniref:hypothetical protein n=1 Tax=Ramlibacter alkalitolerans TaxID=2039631 RepID=UPI002ED241FC